MLETKHSLRKSDAGFTLFEMLVVVGIIAAITGIFLINFNRLEGSRNLRIAQNQLTTDIRKIQSYALSSRNVSNSGKPASYYLIKFDTSTPTSYILGALDNEGGYYDLQTIKLPRTVVISGLSMKEANGAIVNTACGETAFSLPFGRMLMDYKRASGQTFSQQLKQVMGGGSGYIQSPSGCDVVYLLKNSGDLSLNKNLIFTVTLTDTTSSPAQVKTIELNGISQVIDAR